MAGSLWPSTHTGSSRALVLVCADCYRLLAITGNAARHLQVLDAVCSNYFDACASPRLPQHTRLDARESKEKGPIAIEPALGPASGFRSFMFADLRYAIPAARQKVSTRGCMQRWAMWK